MRKSGADFRNKGDGVLGKRSVEPRSITSGSKTMGPWLLPEPGFSSTSSVNVGNAGVTISFVFTVEAVAQPISPLDTKLVEFLVLIPIPGYEPHTPPPIPKQLPKSTVDMEAARTVGSVV